MKPSSLPQDKPFLLYADCIPVKGAKRSIICDLQRQSFQLIPNSLFELLEEYKGKSIADIKADYEETAYPVIENYFEFLTEHEFVFFTDHPVSKFPSLDTQFHIPQRITNAVVDLDEHSKTDFPLLAAELETVACSALQVRVFSGWDLDSLSESLKAFDKTRIRGIELIVPFSEEYTEKKVVTSLSPIRRLRSVLFHSSPESAQYSWIEDVPVVFTPQRITSASHCGYIHPSQFTVNQPFFLESMNFNNCLHKKLGIDTKGQIKNCPAMHESYGSIGETPLLEVVEKEEFTKTWTTTKDQVQECQDCEFRYLCTDCRVHVKDPTHPNSKPKNCNYDPYSATWQE
ncbi:MAG: grasp-with-spasm system SPASM domain peptide maturase [Bacteroidota bacterium]